MFLICDALIGVRATTYPSIDDIYKVEPMFEGEYEEEEANKEDEDENMQNKVKDFNDEVNYT